MRLCFKTLILIHHGEGAVMGLVFVSLRVAM